MQHTRRPAHMYAGLRMHAQGCVNVWWGRNNVTQQCGSSVMQHGDATRWRNSVACAQSAPIFFEFLAHESTLRVRNTVASQCCITPVLRNTDAGTHAAMRMPHACAASQSLSLRPILTSYIYFFFHLHSQYIKSTPKQSTTIITIKFQ